MDLVNQENFTFPFFQQQEARTSYLRSIAKSRRIEIEDSVPTASTNDESALEIKTSEHINFFKDAEEGVSIMEWNGVNI